MPKATTVLSTRQLAALKREGKVSPVIQRLVAGHTGLPGPKAKRRGRPRKRTRNVQ